MGKTIITYGVILAIAAFILSWLDYRFWIRDIGFEIYGLAIAVIFAGLGIWIERQRRPVAPDQKGDVNEKAILALGLTRRELDMLSSLSSGKSNNRTQAVTKASELSLLRS